MVLVVRLKHVGHFCPARAAPRCPEIYEHPFPFTYKLADFVHLTVRIRHFQVGKLMAYKSSFRVVLRLKHFSHLVSCLFQIGMVGVYQLIFHQLVVNVYSIIVEIQLRESQRNQRTTLFLKNLVRISNLSVNHLVHLIHDFFLMGQQFLPAHRGNLRSESPSWKILLNLVFCQTLIQWRTFQRTVVDIDFNRRSIVEKIYHPLPILCLNGH